MKFDLSSRRAVVTGGCSGIGKTTALRLASAGAAVTAGDFRVSDESRAELEAAGVVVLTCDV
ncbi:MAG TPA: SDR family NAD(P)-dependent oxidoreductase, partial [Pirellulaceae bacterium]|nr:SDR family NAD(P)-dependent oxidoreductase [Pirellulaceae bacterium]